MTIRLSRKTPFFNTSGKQAPRLRRLHWASAATLIALASFLLVSPVVAFHDRGATSQAAADTLQRDATRIASTPDAPPRPDQYLYLKVQFDGGQTGEFWISVDGAHDGLMHRPDLGQLDMVIPGCHAGKEQILRANKPTGRFMPCKPMPAYDPSLPTDAAGFLDVLKSAAPTGAPEKGDDVAGKAIFSRLEFSLLTRAQRVALLKAAGQLQGLSVVTPASNASGAAQVSVSWDASTGTQPIRQGILLDSSSLELDGYSDGGNTVVERGVVDAVSDHP